MARANTCELDPRGFVRVTVLERAELSLDDAREGLDELAIVGGPGRCRALVDMRGIKSISKEGREHYRSRTASVCSRLAMLIGSPVGRVLGNFFFRNLTGTMPTRLFTDEATAIRWLVDEP